MVNKETPPRAGPPTLDEAHATLWRILKSANIRQNPLFIDAEDEDKGDTIDVTVQPERLDHPVTLQLKIISAAVVPWRPRWQRRS